MSSAASVDLARESRLLYREWIRSFNARTPANEVTESGGLVFDWSNTLLPVFNQAILTEAVSGEAQLAAQIERASVFAAARPVPWLLTLFNEFVPEPAKSGLEAIMARAGLTPAFTFTGMFTNQAAPVAPPPGLEIRRVESPAELLTAGDLNCLAYDIPLEMGRDMFQHPVFGDADFAYLGLLDGEPVATATASRIHDWLYVSFVATRPDQQRRGFAGAVMSAALTNAALQTGVTRTLLHATAAGYKVYERMGYAPLNTLSVWSRPH